MVLNDLKKVVFITGITGQDGSYLAEFLLSKGFRIIGITRDLSKAKCNIAPSFHDQIEFIEWDYSQKFDALLADHQPDEFYNFAGYSSGQGMYDAPVEIGMINGIYVAEILNSIHKYSPKTKFCQASSSEVFGAVSSSPQTELTSRNPRSPYGAAKEYADSMVEIYRQHYGIFSASAILYNHESVRRSTSFISRKISSTVAKIISGQENQLLLGNLDAKRDWGFAGDYVRAMYLMLQQEKPDDYLIATGQLHTVRDLCKIAFEFVNLDYRDYVKIDPSFYRENEPVALLGDASKAKSDLSWSPSISFERMITDMVKHDLQIENVGR